MEEDKKFPPLISLEPMTKKYLSLIVPSGNKNAILKVDGLACQGINPWAGTRSTLGFKINRNGPDHSYYFEMAVGLGSGTARLGFCAKSSNVNNIGGDATSWAYGGTGKKSHNGSFVDWGETFGKGDTIGALINLKNGEIYFFRNTYCLGRAFTVHFDDELYASISLRNINVVLNLGATKYSFPPKFQSLDEMKEIKTIEMKRSLETADIVKDPNYLRSFLNILGTFDCLYLILKELTLTELTLFRSTCRLLTETLEKMEEETKVIINKFEFGKGIAGNETLELEIQLDPIPKLLLHQTSLLSNIHIVFESDRGKHFVSPGDTQTMYRRNFYNLETTTFLGKHYLFKFNFRFYENFPLRSKKSEVKVSVYYYSFFGYQYKTKKEKKFPLAPKPRYDYCLHGSNYISLWNGERKLVQDITIGDKVLSISKSNNIIEPTNIISIVKNDIRNSDNDNSTQLAVIDSPILSSSFSNSNEIDSFFSPLLITPLHPMKINNHWCVPMNLTKNFIRNDSNYVYNFIVENRSSLFVNGHEVCTLGQYCEGIDNEDSYFGSERVVQYLQSQNSWPKINL